MNAEDAFINSKERNVFVETTPATELLESLEQGLAHESPLIVLTGETGLGKTTIMREAVARWSDRVHAAWLDAGRVPVDALFGQTIRRFGGHFRGTDQRPEQVGRFAHALNTIRSRKLTPVLVVDDAHELDLVALAELGRIESAAAATNVPFKLVLIGRPSLLERLTDEALQPLEARIGVRGTIGPMSLADTREYLAHRVEAAGGDSAHGFSKKAGREIYTAAAGVPTVVNALSDEAQRCANAAGTAMVGPEHVRAVIAAAFRADAVPEIAPGVVRAAEDDEDDAEDEAPGNEAPKKSKSGSHAKPETAKAKPAIPEKPKVIASHKAPTTPPSAAAHVPPPTQRPAVPLPKMSDLDSSSPRVRDWVSRFTEGQSPIRFGGRLAPPTSPTTVPSKSAEPVTFQSVAQELKAAIEAPETKEIEAPTEAKAAPVEAVEDVVAETPVEDAAIETPAKSEPVAEQAVEEAPALEVEALESVEAEVEVEAEPAAESDEDANAEAAAEALAQPVPTASKLELMGLAPEDTAAASELKPVAIEVKPEQLASPPLQVDEAPAPWTPEPPPREPLPPPAEDDLHVPSLTAAEVTPVVAAAKNEAPANDAIADAPVVERRHFAPRPFGNVEAPSSTPEPVSASAAPPSPPLVETEEENDDAIASPLDAAAPPPPAIERRGVPAAPSSPAPGTPNRKRLRAEARRAERAARRAAQGAARADSLPDRPTVAPVQGSHVDPTPIARPAAAPASAAAPATPTSPRHAETPLPANASARKHAALERFSDGPRSPGHGRILTGVITGLIMLGMALMAIWLGRRGGFDAGSETTPVTNAAETSSTPGTAVEAVPSPAVPIAPPVEATTPSATSTSPLATTTATVAAPAPDEPAPAENGEYCLAVGSYLFEDRARELARTLTRRTGQKARVLAQGRGAEKSYRILYGTYPTEDAATRAADRLLARGIVSEALVERHPQ